ncbi:MAG: phosphotransferase [Firmicutes bacterium]|nr:phosphotransferase [Bacillota bacterium]
MAIIIPQHPDELTPTWFDTVWRERFGRRAATVQAVYRTVLSDQVGAMCEGVRCVLDYRDPRGEAPASVFVKVTGTNSVNRQVARFFHLYAREVWFYQHTSLWSSVALPAVYTAAHDPADEAVVVVLEDLAGHRRRDPVAGLDRADVAALVAPLAGIHAAGWQRREYPFVALCAFGLASADTSIARYEAAWTIMALHLAAMLPPELAEYVHVWAACWTPARQQALHDRLGRIPRTLIHGDLHPDDLLFLPDQQRWVIVDWQTCGAGPAVLDLAYLLGATLGDTAHDTALLRTYYDHLSPAIARRYTYDQLLADYPWALTSTLRYVIMVGAQVDLRNDGLKRMSQALLTRLVAANHRWHTHQLWT